MLNRKLAIVIEDSKSFNAAVTSELEEYGLVVDQAYSLVQANQLLQEQVYDFIFVDLGLPDGRGEEIVLQQHFGVDSKVIVFTGESHLEMRERMFTHGILDYFTKRDGYDVTIREIRLLLDELMQNPKITILVIDDSRSQLAMVQAVFEKRNYNVLTASNAFDGLSVIQKEKIDLVILDLEMPGMNGEQMLERLRTDEKTLQLPVIILSGTENMDMVARVLKGGADNFIKKPFLIEELVLKSRVTLRLSKALKELREYGTEMEGLVKRELDKRQEQERLLARQSRMATMGELIGNIAHQWRQPLNALSLVLSKVSLKMDAGKLDKSELDTSMQAAFGLIDKMSSTIDDFRNYFIPEKQKTVFSMLDSVENALKLIGPTLEASNIKIDRNRGAGATVLGYPNEFSQVLMVILGNAKDAITANKKEGGRIKIWCEPNESTVKLFINDNGGGIPDSVLAKIFDPYFTTKGPEQGTGIGLYMSRQIIEESMGGEISAKNTEDGANFIITLPIAREK